MKVEKVLNMTVLYPEEGYKYITNGTVYSEGPVYLGKNDSVDNWQDTNEEPPIEEPLDYNELELQ